MPVLDPKLVALVKDGFPVDGFRVMGRVDEFAVRTSMRTGLQGLRTSDLPASISLRLDVRGESPVQVHNEDRNTAIEVARHVRTKLLAGGWNLVSAMVAEKDGGRLKGEHDMVLDLVSADAGPRGMVSAELKCRRLVSEAGKTKVLSALRMEQVEKCKWWQDAVQRRPGTWRGRMVILAIFDRAGKLTGSHAEWKPVDGSWKTVWSWRAQAVALQCPAPPRRLRAAVVTARPAFPKLRYRREEGKLVSPVAPVFSVFSRATSNVGRYLDGFKRRHRDLTDDVFQASRKAGKKGGQPEWVGTAAALERLHAEL